MIEKEKHAVDAEYKLGLKDDKRRKFYVDKATSNLERPYSKLSTGNLQTLSSRTDKNLTEKVEDFFKQHYFTKNMVLTLYGPQSIEELQQMDVSYSTDIKSKELAEKTSYGSIPIYEDSNLRKLITIATLEDQHLVELRFPIENHIQKYRTLAAEYIAKMLNRKDLGSLYDVPKENNWINIKKGQ